VRIEELGKEGEQEARILLKKCGFWIMQVDWMGERNGEYLLFEIKKKEKFKPPPFVGHGLDYRQVVARLRFQKKTGIRCMFLVKDVDDGLWYWNYLDILEDGEKFMTRNKIRVYPLTAFNVYEPHT